MKYLILFIASVLIMMIELLGIRIMAPYFGSTPDVITSIITVVLISLSVGYYIGGRLADNQADMSVVANILYSGSILLIIMSLYSYFFKWFGFAFSNYRLGVIISSLIFFSPINLVMGLLSPIITKIIIKKSHFIGQSAGYVYAIGAIGSVIGTIITGFWLIPNFNLTLIIVLSSIVVFLLSLLISKHRLIKTLFFVALITLAYWINFNYLSKTTGFLVDINSQYQNIKIRDDYDLDNKTTYRSLFTNNQKQSTMDVGRPNDLVVAYTQVIRQSYECYYPLAKHYLMIGGGGYSLPKNLLSSNSQAMIDVVEVDSQITKLAQKYFNLPLTSRLTIYHQDGRRFINQTDKVYDVVVLDVFNSRTTPFYLLTKEFLIQIKQRLSDNGVVIINLVASYTGPLNEFLATTINTFQSVFGQVDVYNGQRDQKDDQLQNIIIVVSNNQLSGKISCQLLKPRSFNHHLVTNQIYTDDYAPIEKQILSQD